MHHLLRKKTLTLLCTVLLCLNSSISLFSQEVDLNLADHDEKRYYLGIGLMLNNSRFLLNRNFLNVTSQSIYPDEKLGFGLAGIHNFRLSDRFEVRAIFPQLLFSYKYINYVNGADTVNKVESILLGLPVHLKFKSDRINNFRVYAFAGGKLDLNLSSSKKIRDGQVTKIKQLDTGFEAGFGFNFYFPVFILSPEIKISNGLQNIHIKEPANIYSNQIDQLKSRMVVLSFIFEG